MSDQEWRVYVMPTDPNTGVVRSGVYPSKPTLEESESGMSIWITTNDDDDPVIIVPTRNCLSVLVAQQHHIDALEAAEREMSQMREAGAMGAGDEPTP